MRHIHYRWLHAAASCAVVPIGASWLAASTHRVALGSGVLGIVRVGPLPHKYGAGCGAVCSAAAASTAMAMAAAPAAANAGATLFANG